MATETNFISNQGAAGRRVHLAVGEVATITFRDGVYWERGGVSISVFPDRTADGAEIGGGGTVEYEHSLSLDGPLWTADPASPFDKPRGVSESSRISRVRITPRTTTAIFEILSPVAFYAVYV